MYKVDGTFDQDKKNDADLSGYSTVKFAIKSNSYFLISGWSIYLKESQTDWVFVTMTNKGDNTWEVTIVGDVYTGDVENPWTHTYTGNSIATILADWYNGVDIYVTELRGTKAEAVAEEPVEDHNATWGEQVTVSPVEGGTTVSNVVVPNGFGRVSLFNTGDGASRFAFSEEDLSSYVELRFAYKSSSWMLFNGWENFLHEPDKWVSVVMQQKENDIWKVSVYSTADTYTTYYTGNKLSEILTWYNDAANTDFYFTDLRGVKKAETNKGTAKISNLLLSKLYTVNNETVPEGFENVYIKYGLAQGDFSSKDISVYDSIKFMIKLYGILKVGDTTISPNGEWISVELKNSGDNSWTVIVGDKTFTDRSGTTLQEILNDWSAGNDNFIMCVTDLRGTWGSIKLNEVKAIAMSVANKSDVLIMRAAERLSAELKQHAGIELLIEYHEDQTTFAPNKSYIVLGSLAAKLGMTSNGITSETGCKINIKNGHICLYAKNGNGMLNAVYELLKNYMGLNYYTDTVFTITNTDPVFKSKGDIIVNYSFDYTWAIDGAITKSDDGNYNTEYMDRLGFSNAYDDLGGGWHNFTTIVSEEKYGANGTVAQHPEWFVTRTADTVSFVTLDIQNYCDAILTD